MTQKTRAANPRVAPYQVTAPSAPDASDASDASDTSDTPDTAQATPPARVARPGRSVPLAGASPVRVRATASVRPSRRRAHPEAVRHAEVRSRAAAEPGAGTRSLVVGQTVALSRRHIADARRRLTTARSTLAWRWPRLGFVSGDALSDRWPSERPIWARLATAARGAAAGLRRARARAGWAAGPWALALPLVAVLLVLLAAGAGGYLAVTRGAPLIRAGLTAPAAANAGPAVVIRPAPASGTPTPNLPAYELGVWSSNSSPSPSGEVQIYVRITSLTSAGHGTGVAHVPVTLRVTFPSGVRVYGPVRTNAFGLAVFTVSFHNLPPARPVFVAAFAPAGTDTTYTATTVFAAS